MFHLANRPSLRIPRRTLLEERLCQCVLILAIKASTNSQALRAVAGIVQEVAVWSKIQVLNFDHPKKVAYQGLKLWRFLLRRSSRLALADF